MALNGNILSISHDLSKNINLPKQRQRQQAEQIMRNQNILQDIYIDNMNNEYMEQNNNVDYLGMMLAKLADYSINLL